MKDGYVKVAAATPDIRVADTEYNEASIQGIIDNCKEQDVRIAVFPELCLTGYTCGDLFLQDVLLDNAVRSLVRLVTNSRGSDMLCIVGLPLMVSSRLYNVAAVFQDGDILGIVPKANIPNYSEFYESRHFAAGAGEVTEITLEGYDGPVLFGQKILFE